MSNSGARILLLGSRGQLGQALLRESSQRGLDVFYLTWDSMQESARLGESVLRNHLNRELNLNNVSYSHVLFANGLTDPSRSIEDLVTANVRLPHLFREIIGPSARFVSFGSIMERLPHLCETNRYLRSKLELCREVQSAERSWDLMHVRIHTLYGAYPPAHMFLGQILAALNRNESFSMTSGRQMREYHHVDDVSRSVWDLVLSPSKRTERVFEMTSGEPVRLADLARFVFKAFGRENLLRVGSLQEPDRENIETRFEATFPEVLRHKRPVLTSVVEVLKAWLDVDNEQEARTK